MKIQPKPSDVTWTDDQWKAISAEGNNILVAAAAGSGKTAVLVERIIRKVADTDIPIDVDRLLVVTFTNAAAAEMRHRIGEAIEKKLATDPRSLHLRRQLSLLHRANISTLHSFCMNVVRKYYYEVEVDPNFRILDDTEGQLIREEVIDDMFEEEYGKDDNQVFFDLVDQYSGDRSDDKLRSLVLHLFSFSRSHPQPFQWLDGIIDNYELKQVSDVGELSWAKEALHHVRNQLSYAASAVEQGLQITKEPEGPYKYADTFVDELTQLQHLSAASTWEDMYERFQSIHFGRIPSISKKDAVDHALKEKAKNFRDEAKEMVTQCKDHFFQLPPQVILEDLQLMGPTLKKLSGLVKRFSDRYMFEKRDKGVLDFSDLEHLCLEILTDQDELKKGFVSPSKAAQEFADFFSELLVDEYQDTNLVQETIISLLSKGDNLFMVGDVKQSIYRFRLAEPTLFMKKYKQFQLDGSGEGMRIDLSKNFRSRSEILDGTNFIFRQIMDEEVGEITYDDAAELKLGNMEYPTQSGLEANVVLVNKGEPIEGSTEETDDPSEDSMEEELETSQLEARAMIAEMKKMIQTQYPVYDKNTKETRPITYRDMVILMRSMPWSETIMDECKKAGIPVYAELSTGYFDAVEIRVMLSLLKTIDNPYQDIPLASVLRSSIVHMTEEELAQIRLFAKRSSFYEALKVAGASTNEDISLRDKCDSFITQLIQWRKISRSKSLSELIWQLYQDTGFYDYVGGMPGGKQRQANLRALYDRSRAYESTSFRGLFRFLRFVDRMEERGDDLGTARALGEQEDVVRMMTIHKSKGLEFPVVFMAGMNKMFNRQDLRGDYLLHKELGLGSKRIDPQLRLAYPTIPQQVIKERIKAESLAEEMRVLYVGMTRAKEKIYLIGTVKDVEKSFDKWQESINQPQWLLPNRNRQKASSFLDWIAPAVLRHQSSQTLLDKLEIDQGEILDYVFRDDSIWQIDIVNKDVLQEEGITEILPSHETERQVRLLESVPLESEDKERVTAQLEWRYPYKDATTHRAKQSVSDLKREMQDEYSEQLLATGFQSKYADRPNFLQQKSFQSAEMGTIMHTMMQHLPLSIEASLESVTAERDRLVSKEIFTLEEAEQINVEHIVQFLQSSIGMAMSASSDIYREIPFSFRIPASEAYTTWEQKEDDYVFVQGMIDAAFRGTDGQLILVDYKTDNVKQRFQDHSADEVKRHFKDKYRYQIELYRRALSDSWSEPVSECYLYLFDGDYLIKM
ncbi:helicase-exonuclease AddAB subunit AddA [Salipaludibacillus keqinensis]|uniref:ATP-dependent helicase/nuclease subunit A n=1 Tax=Salipaludibacillus keqinensis TaxID=2045207 RepID=A0A323TN44_9BACI|nr:helicase-exonuclease AddAB subunit AddA [Salipaludibacillus keqinensis]PYZ95097.1 helicase-exonuclease AddAB subunit AddA [Salipaludibacillus keqinensis]